MNYLIALTSLVDGFDKYMESVDKTDLFPIIISFQPHVSGDNAVNLVKIEQSYPGNLSRFDFFPQGLQDDDMVIFTDTSDVIFQSSPPKLEPKIYVAPEYEFWGKDNWWKQHLDRFNFHGLDGEPIYCMGTWAMPFKKVKELLEFMKKNKDRFDSWQMSDQILFNWWLTTQDFEVSPTLMTSLYNSVEKGYTKKEGNTFVNKNGDAYCIVHANGNTKPLLVNESNDK